MLDPRLQEYHKQMQECHRKDDLLKMADVLKEAISLSLDIYGENHEETLMLYTEYGGVLRNLGRYDEAVPVLQKAIRISRTLRGANHPDYASSLVNLANLLRMMEHFRESEALFLEAKQIYERTIGKKSFLYAGLCNNLGLLYQDVGRYEESIIMHKISLDILKDDPEKEILYAVTLNNLVEPFRHLGQRDQAIETLKTAIDIFRRYIERAPVFYAAAINNLGTFYYEEKRYEEAKECFAVGVRISREKLGTKSESYINSMNNYNNVCRILDRQKEESGQTESSQCTYEKLTVEKPFGEDNTDTAGQGKKIRKITKESKGLEIAEAYFFEVCYPELEKQLPEYLPRMAAGLIGEGSECYGFDDMISRDHDFGPAFQIYVPAEDVPVYGKKLRALVDKLPSSFAGFGERNTSQYGGGRIGLFTIEDFYDKFLSIHEVPTDNRIWLQMKDYPLSTATNGKVFMDNLGTFTAIRKGFLRHYPRDVQLKKIAASCMQAAQSG
ncbi:MAG: tetratricopeptide repeat protein, partial [Eubacterium sp.]|nr:tetratricopeptide repeat protein [Eubacterium sp.]